MAKTQNKALGRKGKVDTKNSSFENFQNPQEVLAPNYTEQESAYRTFLLQRATTARNQRESQHTEYNTMTYSENYATNMKAANSFTPPRKNAEDTQVVTGTTREKVLAIVSAVLQLSFETTFRAFDNDSWEDIELGEAMTECVWEASKREHWDEKKIYAYFELASQGNVYIEEVYVDETRIEKTPIKISDVTEETFKTYDPGTSKKIIWSGCRRNIISGLQVYKGNMRQPDIRLQPFLFTKEVIPYEVAKMLYGHLPRWKNVQRTRVFTLAETDDDKFGLNWRMGVFQEDMVEVLKYQDKPNNEYNILLNGVMQLPMAFPLPWGYQEYNIVQGSLEPISAFFSESKSIPTKTKLDQEILDEMYRLAVLKTQKSFMPPIANYSQNILSKYMFLPGKVNNNLVKGEIEVLGGDPGQYSMKPSEFEMIQMIKKFIDEKSIDPNVQGNGAPGTATQVTTVTQQAKQKLGLLIFGFMQLHMNLDLLRLYNILENYTQATGTKLDDLTGELQDKFRTVSVNKEVGGRGLGLKKIQFTNNHSTPAALYDQEEGIQRDDQGTPLNVTPPKTPMKIMQINPKVLRELELHWYGDVIASDKEPSLAQKIDFEDSLQKAIELFGPQAINMQYAQKEWALKNKQNPEYFFNKNQQPQPMDNSMVPNAAAGVALPGKAPQESNMRKVNRGGVKEATRQGMGVV